VDFCKKKSALFLISNFLYEAYCKADKLVFGNWSQREKLHEIKPPLATVVPLKGQEKQKTTPHL
jgi:hypothetical protein